MQVGLAVSFNQMYHWDHISLLLTDDIKGESAS